MTAALALKISLARAEAREAFARGIATRAHRAFARQWGL